MPACTVAIRNGRGVPYWVTTAGDTLFEACAAALDFVARDFWKAPKPRPDTVLEVHVVGSHQATGCGRARSGSGFPAGPLEGAGPPHRCLSGCLVTGSWRMG